MDFIKESIHISDVSSVRYQIKEIMSKNRISVYELWKRTGTDQSTIKRFLDGTTKEPRGNLLLNLLRAVGVTKVNLYTPQALRAIDEG